MKYGDLPHDTVLNAHDHAASPLTPSLARSSTSLLGSQTLHGLQRLSPSPLACITGHDQTMDSLIIQWIGLRENLQETTVFTIKYRAFL